MRSFRVAALHCLLLAGAHGQSDIETIFQQAADNQDAEQTRVQDPSAPPASANPAYQAPGRLGDARLTLGTDPRLLSAELAAAMKPWGMADTAPAPPIDPNITLSEIGQLIQQSSDAFGYFFDNVPQSLPSDANEAPVERSERTIPGGSGQPMKLYLWRKRAPATCAPGMRPPAVMYIHGGGMVVGNTTNKSYSRWMRSLALNGVLGVQVDFRNAWTPDGPNHFPAGLNDVAAAVRWVHANKDKLCINQIVVQGESGGGNLVAAVTLKAKREGWANEISGVYSIAPYISNAYGWPQDQQLSTLPSLIECNGYILNTYINTLFAHYYAPNPADRRNPLAWPYYATDADLQGLPPHIIETQELDPLRDEGKAYLKKLAAAGNAVYGKTTTAIGHAVHTAYRQAIPTIYEGTVREIAEFARSL